MEAEQCPICSLDVCSEEELIEHCRKYHAEYMQNYGRQMVRDKMMKIVPDEIKEEWEGKWEDYETNGKDKYICSNCKQENVLPKYGWDHPYRCKCDEAKYCSKHCQKIHWKMEHRYVCRKNRNLDTFNYDEDWDYVEFLQIIVIIMQFAKADIL